MKAKFFRLQHGFTLLELQVAILVLILIFAVIGSTLYFFSKSWRLSNTLAEQQHQKIAVINLIRQQVNAMRPVHQATRGHTKLFFEGHSSSIYYVGRLPGYLVRGGPWLMNLYWNKGTSQLILKYKTIDTSQSFLFNRQNDYQQVVLLDGVTGFTINYAEENGVKWRKNWVNQTTLPRQIEFTIEHQHQKWPQQLEQVYSYRPLFNGIFK